MNIGIVGSGKIVKNVLSELTNFNEINVSALCVREKSLDKGQQLKIQFNIDKLYTDYDELLNDPNLDFIYLGLPNLLHFDYTKKALLAEKNVICEKPFTTNLKELKELVALAKKNNCFLFEAITTLYLPNLHAFKERIKELQGIKMVHCHFSQYSTRYDEYLSGTIHPVFSKDAYGGALYDMNVYNLHLVLFLFGSPNKISYFSNKGFNGVDTSGTVLLEYSNFLAHCSATKDCQGPSFTLVQGKNGYARIEGASNTCDELEFYIDKKHSRKNNQENPNWRFIYEFSSFHRIFQTSNFNECYQLLDHSIKVMEILDEISL